MQFSHNKLKQPPWIKIDRFKNNYFSDSCLFMHMSNTSDPILSGTETLSLQLNECSSLACRVRNVNVADGRLRMQSVHMYKSGCGHGRGRGGHGHGHGETEILGFMIA